MRPMKFARAMQSESTSPEYPLCRPAFDRNPLRVSQRLVAYDTNRSLEAEARARSPGYDT